MSERPPADEDRAAVLSSLDAEVRRVDEARWLAARFAPAPARARLTALYAFHHEIARVRETVSDPLVGEIRLAWWREAIGEIYETPERARRHPVVSALITALGEERFRPPRALLEALIDARLRDLDDRGFADVAELGDYAGATAGGLTRVAARLLAAGEVDAATEEGLAAAGRAWGLSGLARAFPAHAASGWIAIPGAPPHVEIKRIIAEHDANSARRLLAPVIEAAEAAWRMARAALRGAPAELWPAYGYVALVPAQLRTLAGRRGDPFGAARARVGLRDRVQLVLAAARGGV